MPQKESIELAWRSVWEKAATCARIALTGFPYSVSLFTTGFICMWILFLPLTYLGSLSWWGVLPIFVVAVLLLGEAAGMRERGAGCCRAGSCGVHAQEPLA